MTSTKNVRLAAVLSLIPLALILAAGSVKAGAMDRQVVSAGGYVASSSSLAHGGTVGQLAVGHGTSSNLVLAEGFWLPAGVEDYLCGDSDASGGIDIDDVVHLISYIFTSGPEPIPYEAGDADCSGGIDIDDVVRLIGYIFSGGYTPCDNDGDGVSDC